VTFKGGVKEPMHSWYPLIQGYSSSFVRTILNHFAPSSQRVLDPFSGTGTTVLEAYCMGKKSFYCEVNPALQLLTHIKIKALSMDDKSRRRLAKLLHELSKNYKALLLSVQKDEDLELSYESVFGESHFFFPETFEKVLKARSLIDEVYYSNPLVADFLTIATLASLIPASLLKRAGDLRFRRPNEYQKIKPLESCICKNLNKMAEDLLKLKATKSTQPPPLLICEDARKIRLVKPLKIDAVVTSPPYVNGTNYIRNTKVELWFLRCLHTKDDLKKLRTKAVTTGINTVQKMKMHRSRGIDCPELDEVISKLETRAYDKRIPVLIESYFAELNTIFDGISDHMVNGGLLAVDIGDSIFAGVHVPTDRILLHILQEKGYNQKAEIVLRKRQSHDGTPLKQVLLVLRKGHTTKSIARNKLVAFSNTCWNSFKKTLPHQKYPFSKRNWGHPLHSLCSYEGKMKPSLAHHLIKTFVPKGGRMLDPFAGVGTIPFEAALHGINSFGFEISPAARYIATAKVGRPDRYEVLQTIQALKNYIANSSISSEELAAAASFGFNHRLSEYYHPKTLKEIVLARNYFKENKPSNPSECLVIASLLHILHGNRPYSLSRRSHPITPFAPTGPFEYRPLIPRLVDKVNRSLALEYPATFVEGKIFDQDATSWWPSEIDQLDAIVTSPPFFDSTRFYMANWLRLWFCGWEPKDFKDKPKKFLDVRQKSSLRVYESIFRQARERLKENGILVLHLGKSKKCDMASELSKIASPWFRVADVFEESVTRCESHGIRDKGTVKKHQYLVLV